MRDHLPETWAVAELDELVDPRRPICYGILKPGPDTTGGIPYVKVRDIRDGRIAVDALHRTTPEIEGVYRRSRLRGGDLLISIRGTYGRVAFVPSVLEDGNITQDSARLAIVGVDPQYIRWYLEGPAAESYQHTVARGVAVKGVNIRDLRRLPVAVPPLDEQGRIVAELERRLSHVRAALASLDRAARQLEVARESFGHALFWSRDTPRRAVADLVAAKLQNGRSVKTRPGGFPVLRLTCLKGGRIDLRETKAGDWNREEGLRYAVQAGDFLVARGNGSLRLVGRGGLVLDEPAEVAFPDTLIRIRADESKILPGYLSAVWTTQGIRRQIETAARTTTGIYKVNQGDLASIVLPVPSLGAQAELLAEFERRSSLIDAAQRSVAASAKKAKQLRRSLLAAAFSGRLVRQHPGDGSASELIENIRAQRRLAADAPRPPRRKKESAA